MNARSDGQPQFRIRRYPYGVYYRKSRTRPWIVKFKRNKHGVYVGSYETLDQATLAANEYLLNEYMKRLAQGLQTPNVPWFTLKDPPR